MTPPWCAVPATPMMLVALLTAASCLYERARSKSAQNVCANTLSPFFVRVCIGFPCLYNRDTAPGRPH